MWKFNQKCSQFLHSHPVVLSVSSANVWKAKDYLNKVHCAICEEWKQQKRYKTLAADLHSSWRAHVWETNELQKIADPKSRRVPLPQQLANKAAILNRRKKFDFWKVHRHRWIGGTRTVRADRLSIGAQRGGCIWGDLKVNPPPPKEHPYVTIIWHLGGWMGSKGSPFSKLPARELRSAHSGTLSSSMESSWMTSQLWVRAKKDDVGLCSSSNRNGRCNIPSLMRMKTKQHVFFPFLEKRRRRHTRAACVANSCLASSNALNRASTWPWLQCGNAVHDWQSWMELVVQPFQALVNEPCHYFKINGLRWNTPNHRSA